MAHDPVEDAPPVPVLVHPEFEEMAQKAPALRHAESERVTNARFGQSPPSAIIGFGVLWGLLGGVVFSSDNGAEAGRTGGADLPMRIGKPAAGMTANAAARRMPGRPACSPASG